MTPVVHKKYRPKRYEKPTLQPKLFICCVLVLMAGCARLEVEAPQTDSVDKEHIRFQGKFPGSWIEQLMFAHNDFQTTGQDSACFTVYLIRRGSEFELSFQPDPEIEIIGDRTRTTTGRNSCGYGVNYRFDSSGRFIKRSYERHGIVRVQ